MINLAGQILELVWFMSPVIMQPMLTRFITFVLRLCNNLVGCIPYLCWPNHVHMACAVLTLSTQEGIACEILLLSCTAKSRKEKSFYTPSQPPNLLCSDHPRVLDASQRRGTSVREEGCPNPKIQRTAAFLSQHELCSLIPSWKRIPASRSSPQGA